MLKTEKEQAKFLEEYNSGIGGSRSAGICGLNDWMTPMSIYLELKGQGKPFEGNQYTEWGNRNEANIIKKFEDETGYKVIGEQDFFRHPEFNFMICHVDGLVCDPEQDNEVIGVLEVKTAGFMSRKNWGDPETEPNRYPQSYLIQCLHNFHTIDSNKLYPKLKYAFLAVLIGGNDYRQYTITPDIQAIQDLVSIEKNFWNDMLNDIPPTEYGTEASRRYFQNQYPTHIESEIQATDEIDQVFHRLFQGSKIMAQAMSDKAYNSDLIIEFMEDNGKVVGPDWSATYRKNKDGSKTDWEAVAREIFDRWCNPDSSDSFKMIVSSHTKVKPGARVFRPSFTKLKKSENQ